MSPKAKVLVADDERIIADTLTIILNQSGFETTAAYSGEEVVEIVEQNGMRTDILVCDVVMAGMNGIETAVLVRKTLPSCRIILLSGQAVAAELLDDARAQGYEFELLAKPLHPMQLIAQLRGDIGLDESA
jgi:CheY-like chemotaxis protein